MSTTKELARATIMVVDDDQVNLDLWVMLLSKAGHAALPVADGSQAVTTALKESPDLILLDIMMPNISGYDVCKQIKADPRTHHIPVIFLSALSDTVDKVKAFSVGGVDYISKPFEVEEVLVRIKTHLSLRELEHDLRQKNAQLQQEVLERRQAEERFRSYADRLQTLHAIDQSILAARSPETIAIAAVGRIRQLIPCQRVTVLAIDEQKHLKTLAADSNSEIALGTAAEGYQEVLNIQALSIGRPYGLQNLSMLPTLSPMQEMLYTAGVRSYIIVPLFMHDELLGTLHLESTQPSAFDVNHVTVATEIAVLLSIAIRQVRLYELAQQEIKERKQVEQALREKTLELEARNAELDAYAHTVAHDLKTPLSSLLGFSHLLEKRYANMSSEKFHKTLGFITESARRMTDIINELLLLASVRKMEDVALAPLDMSLFVSQALERVSNMAKEHQAKVVVARDWPVALGYGPWIEEVWANYLSNAIKYGGKPPRVELGAEVLPDHTIRFWVRDNGEGLSPEQKSRLFTAFTRLDQKQAEGHGLGLSIVQRIISKLGGKVGVKSELGEGSEFYFTLPSAQKIPPEPTVMLNQQG